ncbi:toprim domain-containing protein [Chryseobacterium sp. 1B4]
MNCKQFNSIGLEEVLHALGHLPVRENAKEAWYLSPFGIESQASFKVDRSRNVWYLFSEGIGGTNTDFMQKYLGTPIKGVLEWASAQNFSSFHQQPTPNRKIPAEYRIDKVMELTHLNLLQYLRERGLSSKVYRYLKEIWFNMKEKPYYAIGFQNRSGGWEVRNPYYKGALLSKDISILNISSECRHSRTPQGQHDEIPTVHHDKIPDAKIVVVEGFMDALSFIEMKGSYQGDLLVLNSTSLLKKTIDALKRYTEINLFLDNDRSGRNCTAKILKAYPHANDYSHIYADHKDLNGYLMERRMQKFLATPKTEAIPKQENNSTEKQEPCKEEKNRPTKGLRRRM